MKGMRGEEVYVVGGGNLNIKCLLVIQLEMSGKQEELLRKVGKHIGQLLTYR